MLFAEGDGLSQVYIGKGVTHTDNSDARPVEPVGYSLDPFAVPMSSVSRVKLTVMPFIHVSRP